MGVGHSTVYEEPQVYTYAVRYLLETSGPLLPPSPKHAADATPMFEHEAHDPRVPRNTMVFLPWALRGGAFAGFACGCVPPLTTGDPVHCIALRARTH